MNGLDGVTAVHPLAPIQEGMLFHSVSAPETGVFVTQICLELRGPFDADALRHAWEQVIARHSVLRTAYFWDGLDAPLAAVKEDVSLPWHEEDWRGRDPAEFDAYLAQDRALPIDLTDAPAMRLVLLRWGDDAWRLLWTFHHAVLDGWSANIVLRDVLAALAGSSASPRSLDYSVFAERAVAATESASSAAFWRARLQNRHSATAISDPQCRPAAGSGHAHHDLGAALTDDLTAFTRGAKITMNTLVLGAWARVLGTLGDDPQPLFGTTITTRPHDLEGAEEAVGVYINTVPIGPVIDETPMVAWLSAIQAEQQAMQGHAMMSLTEIQRQSAIPQGQPLFDSIVVFENHGAAEDAFASALSGSGLTATIAAFVDQSNYPLALLAIPGATLRFELVYDRARFHDGFALMVLQSLERALRGMLSAESAVGVSLAETQRNKVEAAEHAPLLPDMLAFADTQPDHAAVISDAGSLSYRGLADESAGLAHALIAQGVRPGDFVGLYAPRGSDFVRGMLAIHQAGAAFVPLDPDYPSGHNQASAEDAGLHVVLATRPLADQARVLAERVITLDARADGGMLPGSEAMQPAYLIHTSGSQGTRKGVAINHSNIAYSTRAREAVYGAGPARFLLLSPMAFDSAMVGLFWTLSTGGSLVLPRPGDERDVTAVADLIAANEVTHLLCIPSLYWMILDFAPAEALASLDTAIVAGEPCPPDLVEAHLRVAPHARLFNEYGPTEASVWCLAAQMTHDDARGPVSIGAPIPGTFAQLTDRFGHPVPDHVAGQLSIAGPGVARGYHGLPQATAERFRAVDGVMQYDTGDLALRRAGGDYLYLGRSDDQIKVNGFRIEPGEIARKLAAHAGVSEAFVCLHAAETTARKRLIAFAQSAEPEAVLAAHLAGVLPAHMQPDRVIALDALPRLPNGKVDARSLAHFPLPDAPREMRALESDAEHVLAEIWRELLGVSAVSPTDDFFALGGDSLMSIRMISMARQEGLAIKPADLADHPTLGALARIAERAVATAPAESVTEAPLLPIQAWHLGREMPEPAHWAMSHRLTLPNDTTAEALQHALDAVMAAHPGLQVTFKRDGDGAWRQVLSDTGNSLQTAYVEDDAEIGALQGGIARALRLDGPMLAAVLLQYPAPRPPEILLVAQHLVVDVVSWSILADDLKAALAGRALAPAKSALDWATELAARADTPAPHHPEGYGLEHEASQHRITLDTAVTEALLGEANQAYNTEPLDLIVWALAEASGTTRLDLESHGRQRNWTDTDLTRCVGWLTTAYAVTLTLPEGAEARAKAVKEKLRGALHDAMQGDPDTRGADILLNFLGRQQTGTGAFAALPTPSDGLRAPDSPRSHGYELNLWVAEGALHITLVAAGTAPYAQEASRLTERFAGALRDVVDHCRQAGAGGFTPSDFPEAGLDQADLDAFLDEL
ncbi:MAG: amino acid adenylation domain-containing protein [Pseudomonadota bacterium]